MAGSVCGKCYALKGRFTTAGSRRAQARRLRAFEREPATWAEAFKTVLREKAKHVGPARRCMRWFDSGDVQSVEMAKAILEVVVGTGEVRHWVSTREPAMWVRALKELGWREFPPNVVVRVAATMIGQARELVLPEGFASCSVGANVGHKCPAIQQGHQCRECRACWDRGVRNVDYELH